MLTLLLGLAVDLDPGVAALYGHAQALGHIGHRFAFFGHLLDRFDLEFFGLTLTTHGTSYLGLIMRFGGVYDAGGDSGLGKTCVLMLYRVISVNTDFLNIPETEYNNFRSFKVQIDLMTVHGSGEIDLVLRWSPSC